MMEQIDGFTWVDRDIYVSADETNEQAIERCRPEGATAAEIVGGFPVGSWWERTKGIVVRYQLPSPREAYRCPRCGEDCGAECTADNHSADLA